MFDPQWKRNREAADRAYWAGERRKDEEWRAERRRRDEEWRATQLRLEHKHAAEGSSTKDTLRSIGRGLPAVLLVLVALGVWLAAVALASRFLIVLIALGIAAVLFLSWVIGTSPEGD